MIPTNCYLYFDKNLLGKLYADARIPVPTIIKTEDVILSYFYFYIQILDLIELFTLMLMAF